MPSRSSFFPYQGMKTRSAPHLVLALSGKAIIAVSIMWKGRALGLEVSCVFCYNIADRLQALLLRPISTFSCFNLQVQS